MYTSGKRTDRSKKKDQVSDLIKRGNNIYMKKTAYDEAQMIHTDIKICKYHSPKYLGYNDARKPFRSAQKGSGPNATNINKGGSFEKVNLFNKLKGLSRQICIAA